MFYSVDFRTRLLLTLFNVCEWVEPTQLSFRKRTFIRLWKSEEIRGMRDMPVRKHEEKNFSVKQKESRVERHSETWHQSNEILMNFETGRGTNGEKNFWGFSLIPLLVNLSSGVLWCIHRIYNSFQIVTTHWSTLLNNYWNLCRTRYASNEYYMTCYPSTFNIYSFDFVFNK